MNDPLKELLEAGVLSTNSFPPNSRYHGTEFASLKQEGGEEIVYLRRRFIPAGENYSLVQHHTVVDGDRVDNLATHYLGDPELYWRLCDANEVMHPDELTESVGEKIAITLPENVPGGTDD